MDWSGVDYLWIIVMFLSAVWILILTAPIHCRGSIAEQINSSTSWIVWEWVNFQQIYFFRMNYSLNPLLLNKSIIFFPFFLVLLTQNPFLLLSFHWCSGWTEDICWLCNGKKYVAACLNCAETSILTERDLWAWMHLVVIVPAQWGLWLSSH